MFYASENITLKQTNKQIKKNHIILKSKHETSPGPLKKKFEKFNQTSGQDGSTGRHIVPPQTIKRRTTINLKTKKQPELTEN